MDISSEHIISSFDGSSLYKVNNGVSKGEYVSKSSVSEVTNSHLKFENSERKVETTNKQNENQIQNLSLHNLESNKSKKDAGQEENAITVSKDGKDNNEIKNESKRISLSNNTFLQFELEEKVDKVTKVRTRELVVYLRDKETGDVIRRVPPEEYVDLYKNKLNAQNRGVFIDRTS